MKWNSPKIATWTASFRINSSGVIDSEGTDLKSITIKGQNPNTTNEDNDYGNIGNTFSEIFGIPYFTNITRKLTDSLEVDE